MSVRGAVLVLYLVVAALNHQVVVLTEAFLDDDSDHFPQPRSALLSAQETAECTHS
jgi:hypothetical protein